MVGVPVEISISLGIDYANLVPSQYNGTQIGSPIWFYNCKYPANGTSYVTGEQVEITMSMPHPDAGMAHPVSGNWAAFGTALNRNPPPSLASISPHGVLPIGLTVSSGSLKNRTNFTLGSFLYSSTTGGSTAIQPDMGCFVYLACDSNGNGVIDNNGAGLSEQGVIVSFFGLNYPPPAISTPPPTPTAPVPTITKDVTTDKPTGVVLSGAGCTVNYGTVIVLNSATNEVLLVGSTQIDSTVSGLDAKLDILLDSLITPLIAGKYKAVVWTSCSNITTTQTPPVGVTYAAPAGTINAVVGECFQKSDTLTYLKCSEYPPQPCPPAGLVEVKKTLTLDSYNKQRDPCTNDCIAILCFKPKAGVVIPTRPSGAGWVVLLKDVADDSIVSQGVLINNQVCFDLINPVLGTKYYAEVYFNQ
jgi:hypothetical protein